MADAGPPAVLVVGVGNEVRGDDGAGLQVARCVRDLARGSAIDVHELQDDPMRLLDVWVRRDAVVLADTMHSGAPPGTIRRLDASTEPLPVQLRGAASTHAGGLAEAIELGRALGRLPRKVIVFAVEGRRFEAGAGLSEELIAVVPRLAELVLSEANSLSCVRQRDIGVYPKRRP